MKKKSNIYFYKNPYKKENKLHLDFKPIFKLNSTFNNDNKIASIFNCIYYCHKNSGKSEIFGLVKIKSNDFMPRFQIAYDSSEFTKEEIKYLIKYLFTL